MSGKGLSVAARCRRRLVASTSLVRTRRPFGGPRGSARAAKAKAALPSSNVGEREAAGSPSLPMKALLRSAVGAQAPDAHGRPR